MPPKTFKTEKEELEYLRSITRCKFFLLNPKYPAEETNTYIPCTQVTGHQGPCK